MSIHLKNTVLEEIPAYAGMTECFNAGMTRYFNARMLECFNVGVTKSKCFNTGMIEYYFHTFTRHFRNFTRHSRVGGNLHT